MAESKPTGKFPDEVIADENVPKTGYFQVTILVPGMKTKTSGVINKVTNVTNGSCKPSLTAKCIAVEAQIGGQVPLSYSKDLPEEIVEKDSKWKLKDGKAIFVLRKAETVSWAQHRTYFQKPPETD